MQYFMQAMRRYADFSGRSRRSEYWYFVLFQILILGVAMAIDNIWGSPILYSIAALVLLVPSLAVSIRRLHDTSRSGWWILLAFIPLIGAIILIVWYATDGTPGTNKWGANPKEAGVGADDLVDHIVE